MYHYTYRLDLPETGEFYFGSRTSKNHPTIDNYLGSMVSWKPEKDKLVKTILKSDFVCREDCIEHERSLIIENIKNSLNRNACIPSTRFVCVDMGMYINEAGKICRLFKDDELIKNGTFKPFWKDRKHTDKAKLNMSKSAKTRKINPENESLRRKNISNKMEGVPKPQGFGAHLSKMMIGNTIYSDFLKKPGSLPPNLKKVQQFNVNNQLIKEWISVGSASKELGISYWGINMCCRGKSKTSGGFIWKYV